MRNVQLGREIVDVMDMQPEQFSMEVWGQATVCGTVACLAGTAMLRSGYKLRFSSVFYRPDGTPVTNEWREASKLLGLEDDEEYVKDGGSIWYDIANGPDRFRKLVEESEGRQD